MTGALRPQCLCTSNSPSANTWCTLATAAHRTVHKVLLRGHLDRTPTPRVTPVCSAGRLSLFDSVHPAAVGVSGQMFFKLLSGSMSANCCTVFTLFVSRQSECLCVSGKKCLSSKNESQNEKKKIVGGTESPQNSLDILKCYVQSQYYTAYLSHFSPY